MDKFIISVLELNTYVSDKLYQDPFLEEIWVQGEVGDISIKRDTAYFVLSDGEASVDCMLFDYEQSGYADALEEGGKVLVQGDISIYRKNGRFRIVATSIQLAGLGEMYARFNRLKDELEQKGYFKEENKQPIPLYPRKIGIVTSREGAAIHDIISIARRRDPTVRLVLYPVKVQGADAPGEIARGIQYLDAQPDVDVMIVGRGGGSAEDLFAFNDVNVVMAVVDATVPIISAVGHESDYTLTDMAADLRAPTPSAAAELAIPEQGDVLERIYYMKEKMKHAVRTRLGVYSARLELYTRQVSRAAIQLRISNSRSRVERLRQAILRKTGALYNSTVLRYNMAVAKMQGLDPEDVLRRGYSMVTLDGFVVKQAAGLGPGDTVDIRFADGVVRANVVEKEGG